MPAKRSRKSGAKTVNQTRRSSPASSRPAHANSSAAGQASPDPRGGIRKAAVEKEQVLAIFQQLDLTGTGKIRYAELAAVLKLCDSERWTDATIAMLFDSMDSDHDATVDLDEFVAWAMASGHEARGGFHDISGSLNTVLQEESRHAVQRCQPLILTFDKPSIPAEAIRQACTKMQSVCQMCVLLAAMNEQADEAVEVMRGLWLGSKRDALNLAWQEKVGICAILNMASDDVDDLCGKYPECFKTLFIPAEDAEYPLIQRHLLDAFAFVESCLSEVPIRPVLVHCVQGLNRSGAIVVACLMLLQRCPLLSALFKVSTLRCSVVNNPHFQEQLISLAHCNGLLRHARHVEVALEECSQLEDKIFRVFAAGPSGHAHLTSSSLRDGLQRIVPELDLDQIAQLEERLAWFRDDGMEGIDGIGVADVCSWLASDSQARGLVLQPLLKHLRFESCMINGSVTEVTHHPASPPAEVRSSRRIDDIGGGLFICAVQALENTDLMDALGIQSVVNCAHETLYSAEVKEKLFARYRIKVLSADDDDTQDLLPLLDPAADFIGAGLQHGGIAVHCASGISRSSAVCIGFLMLRRGLSLSAAFRRVFRARNVIRPNCGFWRQLRDLEAGLLARGIHFCREDAWIEEDEAKTVFQRLDKQAAELRTEHTVYLTAMVRPCNAGHIEAVRTGVRANIVWESLELDGDCLLVRAALVNEAGRDLLKTSLEELCGSGVSVKVE